MIEPLRDEHVDAVATLHSGTITGLLTSLGRPAVKAFYRGCTRTDNGIGLVDIDASGVAGFALGSPHPDRLRRQAMRKNVIESVTGIALGMLTSLKAARAVIGTTRGPDKGRFDDRVAELSYLSVAERARRSGTGTKLVEAFTERMRAAKVDAYDVSVDEDNAGAIAFYEKLGFHLTARYKEFGIPRRRYRLFLR